ncbi:MAG: RNA 2',3'-cyclic phosphodiesterase, partial [Candidatus Dormibacteria bacterium]
MRCFLAVPLGGAALAVAQGTLARLQAEIAGVRWTRPETLHITLHFFGSIDDERVRGALEAVRPVTATTARFEMTTDRLSAFPDRGSPRVLWLGSSTENPAMNALAHRVHERLAASGFAVEERRFRAHCTLGRVRAPMSLESRE